MKLLLHICCGPCAIMPLQHLEAHEVVGFFHNPNIHPLGEYLRRRESAALCAAHFNLPMIYDDEAWNIETWLTLMLPHAKSPHRCELCIENRLEAAAQKTATCGYEAFSTTLLYSRYQPHDFIHAKGIELAQKYGLAFLYEDFRQYWQEGIDQSKKWELYRQGWCGCIFGEAEQRAKMLQKLKNQSRTGEIFCMRFSPSPGSLSSRCPEAAQEKFFGRTR